MPTQVSVARVRAALGDGATVEQARAVRDMLHRAGILETSAGTLQLVGVAEVAALRGVTPSAISQRKDMPEPIVTLKQGRIWDLAIIEPWLKTLPEVIPRASATVPDVQPTVP